MGLRCVCVHTSKEWASENGTGLFEPLKSCGQISDTLVLHCYSSRTGTANSVFSAQFEQLQSQALAVAFPSPSWHHARTLVWSGKDSRGVSPSGEHEQLLALGLGSEFKTKNIRFSVRLMRQRKEMEDSYWYRQLQIRGPNVIWEEDQLLQCEALQEQKGASQAMANNQSIEASVKNQFSGQWDIREEDGARQLCVIRSPFSLPTMVCNWVRESYFHRTRRSWDNGYN